MSRAKTAEEARKDFLDQIRVYVDYWSGADSDRWRLNGLAFSILNMLDGTSGLPSFDLVLRPHPDDQEFCEQEGEDWYEPGQVINADVYLHELWSETLPRPPAAPLASAPE